MAIRLVYPSRGLPEPRAYASESIQATSPGIQTCMFRNRLIIAASSLLAVALALPLAGAQVTPGTTQTTTTTTDSAPMTKKQMKDQKKQQKAQEKAASEQAKADKDHANAIKHADNATDQQEKANTPPR